MRNIVIIFLILILTYSCKKDSEENINPNQVSDVNLVLHYKFDGNLNDNTYKLNHGELIGQAAFSNGLFEKAIEFSSDGYVNCVKYPTAELNDFTFSIWFNTSQIRTMCLFQRGWDYSNGYGLYLESDNNIYFTSANNVKRKTIQVLGPYNDGKWHNIVIQRKVDTIAENISISVYYDSKFRNKAIWNENPIWFNTSYSHKFTIGRRFSYFYNDIQFVGKIDQFRAYSRALSDNEILYLYLER